MAGRRHRARVRPHGETDAILSALTFEHGRHLGLVKGGIGRRARPLLQPGNRLELTWRARLAEHLGNYRVEPMQLLSARLLDDPARLLALASACALLDEGLAEREPHPRLYAGLLHAAGGDADRSALARDLCPVRAPAAAGAGLRARSRPPVPSPAPRTDLAYVSPRTGRAVGRAGAGDLARTAAAAARLPAWPMFLLRSPMCAAGLRLAGHFLRQACCSPRPTSPCPPPASG